MANENVELKIATALIQLGLTKARYTCVVRTRKVDRETDGQMARHLAGKNPSPCRG